MGAEITSMFVRTGKPPKSLARGALKKGTSRFLPYNPVGYKQRWRVSMSWICVDRWDDAFQGGFWKVWYRERRSKTCKIKPGVYIF